MKSLTVLNILQKAEQFFPNLRGKKRAFVTLLLGVLVTLSLPPLFVFPMLVPAFVGLYMLIDSAKTSKEALITGWLFGLGYFTSSLYWISNALLVDAQQFAWLIPFASLGLPSILAIYIAIFAWIMYRIKLSRPAALWLFACIWTLIEVARGSLLSGFPWNLVGYTWAFDTIPLQLASVMGIYGLGFVTIVMALLPLWYNHSRRSFIGIISVFILISVWSIWRVSNHPTEYVEDVKFKLVQANISQAYKSDLSKQMDHVRKHVDLSRTEKEEGITHIIWSETSIPFVLNPGSPLLTALQQTIPPNATLITGVLRSEESENKPHYYNSIVSLSHQQEPQYYDKVHLVPFGEFVPFRSILPVNKITPGAVDFSRGSQEGLLALSQFIINPLVCYEVIFSGYTRDKSVDLLLNLTNDAWFGRSLGPYQHFYMSRVRAVENGTPLIRVANSGISAVIDPYGRILERSNLMEETVITTRLPKKLASNTPYGSY
jgi:apolipoprotein N-acyltransferase